MKISGGFTRLVWVALVTLVAMGGVVQAQEDIFSKVPENAAGMLVFRDGVAFDKKFERMVMQIMPMQPGNPMLQVVAQVLENAGNVQAAQLKADAPVAIAIMMPANIIDDEPQVLMIVQPQDFEAFVKDMEQADGLYDRGSWQLSHVLKSGDYAILGDAEGLAAFRAAKLGMALNDQQKKLWDGSDVMVLANLKQIMTAAAPAYNAAIAEKKSELAELGDEEDAAAERSKMQLEIAMAERFWALGQELNWMGLAATLDARAMWLQSALSVSETGVISSYLAGHPAIEIGRAHV